MAYIRTRTTKAGSVSTTLVESYRDKQGRPRQRILANLHGEPDTLRALAKLAAMHDVLSEQLEKEHPEPDKQGTGFVLVPERALTEYNHRMVQIDRQLAAIERDIAGVIDHCSASDDEFQEAVQRHREEFRKLLGRAFGLSLASKQASAEVRRKLT